MSSRTTAGTGATSSFSVVRSSLTASSSSRRIPCTLLVRGRLFRRVGSHLISAIGYAGYYGLSLIVGSYAVLFVSLAAHAAQFGFLVFFENPRECCPPSVRSQRAHASAQISSVRTASGSLSRRGLRSSSRRAKRWMRLTAGTRRFRLLLRPRPPHRLPRRERRLQSRRNPLRNSRQRQRSRTGPLPVVSPSGSTVCLPRLPPCRPRRAPIG